MSGGESFASNIAAGLIGPAERELLQKGFTAWLAAGGARPLETCLHLPRTNRALSLANRNTWLRKAWALVDARDPWQRSVLLAAELRDFTGRIWPIWQRSSAPPDGASELRSALFWAMKSGARSLGSGMQIHNVCAPAKQKI